ncbi:MAG: sugar ABC transporter permease [Flavobacteriales bacterium]|jgi:multiple sugar transport system permease protein|nr:sugar ABC transporter permease [Flavobacteriales bacterium]
MKQNEKLQLKGLYFVLPTIVIYALFLFYPMISAFQYSFYKWNLVSDKEYVGLFNYIKLFSDKRFWNSYLTTIHFTVISVIIIMSLAFTLALLFQNKIVYKNVFQSVLFLPVVLTMVSIAVVWKFMFQSTGILSNVFLEYFGWNIKWLTSVSIAPYSMILVNVWKVTGYYMIIFIAGLLNIPQIYYEAATVDGANYLQKLIYITIPQMKNALVLAFVSGIIFSFAAFPQQYIMTEGGPARSTEVLSLLIYKQAFIFTKFGYSSTISVAFFITLFVFSFLQLKIFKSEAT